MRKSLFASLLLLAVWAACPAGAAGLILARVDGEPITLDDLRAEFEQQHQGHMSILGDEAVVRDFLQAAIRRRLFTHEARRMGLQDTEEIVSRVEETRVREAVAWLFDTEVRQQVRITEPQVDQAVEWMRVAAQVIVVLTDTREEALRARQRIVDGESAEDVARDMSRARSRLRGGLEGVGWGQSRSEAFERAVIAAEAGGVLDPLETEEGWITGKVIETEVVDVENPEAVRMKARDLLQQRGVARRRSEYLDELRRKYEAEVRELPAPEKLVALLDGPEQAGDEVLATYRGGRIRLADFVAGIRAEVFKALTPGQQALRARFLLSDRLDQDLLRREAVERWPEVPEQVKAKVRGVENDLIFRHLLGAVVFEGLEVSDDEIHEWYAAHPADYTEPVRLELAIALLSSEQDARQFLDEAVNAARFQELARERSLDKETAARDGVAGWVTEDRAIAELRGETFDLPAGATGGPVRLDNGWLVFHVLARREAALSPEDQVRDSVRATLMKQKSGRRMEEWESQLRAAAEIKVRDGALRKAGEILAHEQAERLREEEAADEGQTP